MVREKVHSFDLTNQSDDFSAVEISVSENIPEVRFISLQEQNLLGQFNKSGRQWSDFMFEEAEVRTHFETSVEELTE